METETGEECWLQQAVHRTEPLEEELKLESSLGIYLQPFVLRFAT